ncbi:MAG: zinc-finger domain-containing protein [Magnetovibrio sp.]|nr:zinc-finger domain-containing protein [Magnetovibrio sp.]
MDGNSAFETIETETKRVACGGGGAALGHPKVYLEMGEKDEITCPYCSRRYVLKAGAESGEGH